jgi:hypothetical protein
LVFCFWNGARRIVGVSLADARIEGPLREEQIMSPSANDLLHRVNNDLEIIVNCSEIAKSRIQDHSEAEYCAHITSAALRIAKVVGDYFSPLK